jgi:hypothetical protein
MGDMTTGSLSALQGVINRIDLEASIFLTALDLSFSFCRI